MVKAATVVLLGVCVACGGSREEGLPQADPAKESVAEPFVEATAQAGEDATPPPDREEKRIEIESYKDVEELFVELNYTPEAWQAGVREVPRIYFTNIPHRWRDKYAQEVTVLTKKRLFFRALAPLVLHSNELILEDRERVQELAEQVGTAAALDDQDREWIAELAVRYGIAESTDVGRDPALMERLLRRVDIVPVSLALSQSAEESGWGTSRFAAEGNALFGQWTWGKQAIKPEQHRAALGNYGIRAFETPLQSVLAYMHNLNTHRAYTDLRSRRAEMRANGQEPTGRELAETLTKYSERGEAYVKSLHTIMNANRLDPADEAYLGDGPRIFLIPVGDGV